MKAKRCILRSLHLLMLPFFLLSLTRFMPVASAGMPLRMEVGLVVSQFSAAITADEDFVAIQPDGNRIWFSGGNYFVSAEQGKIRLGDVLLPSGTTLTMEKGVRVNSQPAGLASNVKETASGHASSNRPETAPKQTKTMLKKFFSVNRQHYRGQLKLYVTQDGRNLTVVNQVPLEDYVNSVLGPQSSPIWPDEAIKAQAVAVRSLACYHMEHKKNGLFSVKAVDPNSFYGGVRAENKNISKVAALTTGEVLYYNDGAAAAYMGESSGGRTVSAAEALQEDIPYLPAVEDFDADAPSFQWGKKIQVVTIARVLNQNGYKVGKLQGYRLTDSGGNAGGDRFPSGRVKTIYWQGDEGSVTLTGEKFAALFALNSTLFSVDNVEPAPEKLDVPIENDYGIQIGKKEIPIEIKGPDGSTWKSVIPGFHFLNGSQDETLLFKGQGAGKGLGLSKWGARGMANEAPEEVKDYYKSILLHYYPGTYLVDLY